MSTKSTDYSEEENRMYNGQTIMSVLSNFGNAATADRICDEIVHISDQPRKVIEPEVKRILRRGITNGFLVKFGKNYLLSGDEKPVEVDSKRDSYKNIGKRNKRKKNIKSAESFSDGDDTEDFLRISRKASLKLTETDRANLSNDLVLLNPAEVIKGVINDLFNMVKPDDGHSDDQQNVIDLESVLSKNLKSLSKPHFAME